MTCTHFLIILFTEDIYLQVLDDECIVVGGGDLEEPEIDDATAIIVESTPKSSATRSHKRKTTEIADVEGGKSQNIYSTFD